MPANAAIFLKLLTVKPHELFMMWVAESDWLLEAQLKVTSAKLFLQCSRPTLIQPSEKSLS